MKRKLFFAPMIKLIRQRTNWFNQANEQPAPTPQITSADINAYRQFLANYQQYN